MSSGSEQRSHSRIEVNQQFQSVDAFVAEYATNVSVGGVFIRSKVPHPVGTVVQLKLSIVMGEGDFRSIEGQGTVLRVENDPERSGMGIAFSDLTPESRAFVDELTQHLKPPGVAPSATPTANPGAS